MAEQATPAVVGADWRTVPADKRTWRHWRYMVHMTKSPCTSAGRGVTVLVCGLGEAPSHDTRRQMRCAVMESAICRLSGGTSPDTSAWDEMTGRDDDGDGVYPGHAPDATYLYAPGASVECGGRRAAVVAEWVLAGWGGRVDVLLLPCATTDAADAWERIAADAHAAGAVVVGDPSWRYMLPGSVPLAVPMPVIAGRGNALPLLPTGNGPAVVRVPVVIPNPSIYRSSRIAAAAAAGIVAMVLAGTPIEERRSVGGWETVRRWLSVRRERDTQDYGYVLPDCLHAVPWQVGAQPLPHYDGVEVRDGDRPVLADPHNDRREVGGSE